MVKSFNEKALEAAGELLAPDVSGTPVLPAQQATDSALLENGQPDTDSSTDDTTGRPLPGEASGLGLRKFRDALRQPRVIRAWQRPVEQGIRIKAERANVRFHADLPTAQAWAYEGSVPGPTIEVRSDREARIDWENGLFDGDEGAHLPFDVVRVPTTSAGAPDRARALTPGGWSTKRAQGNEAFPPIAGTEDLRGATVVHMHGALTNGHNDGWAHNVAMAGGVTRTAYPNRQSARTLWYHDHAMAVTRFNVYAGLAGFYLMRDSREDQLRLPSGAMELVLSVSDRNLETLPDADGRPQFTGRMLYKQAGLVTGANVGEIPFTGPFTMVNGAIWPTKDVDARWYRLRLLNSSNTRVMRFALHDTTDERFTPGDQILPGDARFTANRLKDAMVVIGTEGGFLPAPSTPQDGVLEMGPGERADVLVNFGALAGRTVELRNEGNVNVAANDVALNAQPGRADATVMQFRVAARQVRDPFQLPARLDESYVRYVQADDGTLHVGDKVIEKHGHVWVGIVPPGVRDSVHPQMWEMEEVPGGLPAGTPDVFRISNPDGSVRTLRPVAKLFDDRTTVFIAEKDWVVWNFVHLGGPDHPVHIHMTDFQMLSRRAWPATELAKFSLATGSTETPLAVPGAGRVIDTIGAGMKDTWVIKAGEWVSILGEFAGATGSFMYHCHILDHEDHTMMRPFVVLPKDVLPFHSGHIEAHDH